MNCVSGGVGEDDFCARRGACAATNQETGVGGRHGKRNRDQFAQRCVLAEFVPANEVLSHFLARLSRPACGDWVSVDGLAPESSSCGGPILKRPVFESQVQRFSIVSLGEHTHVLLLFLGGLRCFEPDLVLASLEFAVANVAEFDSCFGPGVQLEGELPRQVLLSLLHVHQFAEQGAVDFDRHVLAARPNAVVVPVVFPEQYRVSGRISELFDHTFTIRFDQHSCAAFDQQRSSVFVVDTSQPRCSHVQIRLIPGHTGNAFGLTTKLNA